MIYEKQVAVFRKLARLTADGRIVWEQGEDRIYSTRIGEHDFCFRFLYLQFFLGTSEEDAGLIEPWVIETCVPGLGGTHFLAGSEGYALCSEILTHAFSDSGIVEDYGSAALECLDRVFPDEQ